MVMGHSRSGGTEANTAKFEQPGIQLLPLPEPHEQVAEMAKHEEGALISQMIPSLFGAKKVIQRT